MSHIHRDNKRRQLVQKHELQRILYKSISQNNQLDISIRRQALIQLNLLPRNSSLARIRNRCIYTGRSRSVYRKFKISRLCFRESAAKGYLPGVFKASW